MLRIVRPGVVFSILLVMAGSARAQSCADYFESVLRLSSELEHPAELRVRMGTVVKGKLHGDQLFGAGGIARSRDGESLEGSANFHWVQPAEDRGDGTPTFRVVRREHVRLLLYREGRKVFIRVVGGSRPIRLEPHCSEGLMYVMDSHGHNGGINDWVFQFPFPYYLRCCQNAVLTQHNDIGRTGAYLSENKLTPLAVEGKGLVTFSYLFSLDVDGQIYAQPLYVPNIKMSDGTHHNVLYVATSTDHLYAFDADDSLNTMPLWHVQLGTPAGPGDLNGWNPIFPNVGITSTPVIDLGAKTIYLVAKSVFYVGQLRTLRDQIFALDITSGKILDSANITASVNGPNGPIDFNPLWQHNRASLLLLKERVYVGYGELDTEGDPNRIYHGWIFSFNAKKLSDPPVVLNTSPNYSYAGIWQSGNGLASDGTYIYVNTGNGSVEGLSNFQPGELGDSVLKLTADLQVAQSYTPTNVRCLDTCDLDLGSAGPVVFPASDTLLSGAKEGIFYVFSRKDMTKLSQCAFRAADQPGFGNQVPYCSTQTDQNGCEVPDPAKFCDGNSGVSWLTVAHTYSNIHGSPVVLQTAQGEYQVYVWAEENRAKMFKYSGGQLAHTATVAQSADGKAPDNSMPGGILSLSANPQGQGAILWGTVPKDCTQPAPDNANCDQYANGPAEGAIDASIPGRLVAFDANTLDELWSDPDLGYFAKFNPPTIADGKVFAPNFGSLSDDCGGNYNAYPRKPQKACGQVRVYGLHRTNIRIPIELIRWPYFWIDPGPLAPGAVRRGD